MRCSEVVRVV
jgi:hypothetical protein